MAPKSYRTMAEFEREETRSESKVGFSLDDLIQESEYAQSPLLFDDQFDEYDPSNYDED